MSGNAAAGTPVEEFMSYALILLPALLAAPGAYNRFRAELAHWPLRAFAVNRASS